MQHFCFCPHFSRAELKYLRLFLFLRLFAWDNLQFPFFSAFYLSHHLDKGSSLSHRSINTVPKLFWLTFVILPFYFWCWSEVCILLCRICNFVSKSPEDSRLSEHHPSFLDVVGEFTDTFTAFMICLSSTTVVFSADQGVVGCHALYFFCYICN